MTDDFIIASSEALAAGVRYNDSEGNHFDRGVLGDGTVYCGVDSTLTHISPISGIPLDLRLTPSSIADQWALFNGGNAAYYVRGTPINDWCNANGHRGAHR